MSQTTGPVAGGPLVDCHTHVFTADMPVYFSEAFGVASGTYEVGIRNAFHSFVAGRVDPDASAGGQCMGPYETMGDAENALNDHMAETRRDGHDVVTTWWSYRGD